MVVDKLVLKYLKLMWMKKLVQMLNTFVSLRCALSSQTYYARNTRDIIAIVQNCLNSFNTELDANSEQGSKVHTKVQPR